jgi:hypothetical protein
MAAGDSDRGLRRQGYWVIQANLGTNTLAKNAAGSASLNLGSSLPAGSVIVAFLSSGMGKSTATANSAALFETKSSGPRRAVSRSPAS